MNSKAVLMRRLVILGIVGLVFLAGCGGGIAPTVNNPPPPVINPPPPASPPNPGPSTVTLLIGDTPPTGVTVLSFGVTVTSAVLQPGDVSLVSAPIRVELSRLQVDTALLGRTPVVPGTYTNLTVTFANPELTILNNTGAAVGTCANGAMCELKPALAFSSVSLAGPPFPLAATANSAPNLVLDLDLNGSIPNGLATINPALTLTVQQSGALEHFKGVFGEVTSLAQGGPIGPLTTGEVANSATLQTHLGPIGITFQLDDVQFEGFGAVGCQDQNIDFSCLRVGQFWDVDLVLFPDGLLETQTIRLKPSNEQELEGLVVAIDNPTQFDIVVLVELPDVAGVDMGNLVRVNLLSGAAFEVVDTSLAGSGLLFSAPSDLLVGQAVTVRLQSAPSGTPLAVATDRVQLKSGAFTARVKSKLNTTDFLVDNLPGNFPSAQIRVQTGRTEFTNISGLTDLNVGDTVSLSGFLLKSAGDPVLLAEAVRKR